MCSGSAAIYSHDQGKDWTKAVPIKGAGCARPRLLKLAAGPLLLSGGRLCVEDTDDISMWLNSDGLAGTAPGGQLPGEWAKTSVSYWHNRLWTGPASMRFDAQINNSNAFATLVRPPRLCVFSARRARSLPLCLIAADCWQAYTSLIPSGPSSGVIIYQKFYSPMYWPPWPQATFMMRFRVV